MDSSAAQKLGNGSQIEIYKILDEIADFTSNQSNWLSLTS